MARTLAKKNPEHSASSAVKFSAYRRQGSRRAKLSAIISLAIFD
jgi:hypothetical protein